MWTAAESASRVHGYGGYGGPQRMPRPASERTFRAGPVPRPASHEVLKGPRPSAVENLRLAAERSAESVREGRGTSARLRMVGNACPRCCERSAVLCGLSDA